MKLNLPSPVQKIENSLFEEKGVEVFVKRDDLIHPQISGNKWRKLKYILKKSESENKTHLVTFGGAFSNHLLATAAAANDLGLQSTGIVRGEAIANETLRLCKAFGMNLIFIDRESYRDKQNYFKIHFSNDKDAYFIDEGGACTEAVEGCAELIAELPEVYDHVFCAAGTGTTAAGIYTGIRKHNFKTQLHVIPVLKDSHFLLQDIEKYIQTDKSLVWHPAYHFGGYAKTSTEMLQFIIDFNLQTGMLIDPVYTGKLVFGLYDLIAKNEFAPGSKILWIHTGGLMGLIGFSEKFERIKPGFTQIFSPLLQK